VAVLMGVITAVMGGILRDIVCRQVPLLLRKEIYLTAAMVGGIFYFVLLHAGVSLWVRDLLTLLLVLVIRGFAIVYNWNLPDIAIRRKP
jgi:membrane protein